MPPPSSAIAIEPAARISREVQIGGLPLTTRVLAGRLIARYPIGAHVDVYVDPGHPKSALLEPAAAGNIGAQVAFTVVFGFTAAILVSHSVAGHVLYVGNGAPLFAFAIPALAMIGALFGVIAYFKARRVAGASARWPTAAGTLGTSAVIEEQIEDNTESDKSTIRKIFRYQLDLRYAYKVDRRDYVGTSATPAWTPIDGLREQAAAAQYKPGSPVPTAARVRPRRWCSARFRRRWRSDAGGICGLRIWQIERFLLGDAPPGAEGRGRGLVAGEA